MIAANYLQLQKDVTRLVQADKTDARHKELLKKDPGQVKIKG